MAVRPLMAAENAARTATAVTAALIALFTLLFASPSAAQVALVNTALATPSSSAVSSLTIARPAGTVSGHVMVAQIAVRGSGSITAPSGWTELRRTDASGGGNVMQQAVYVKVAGATEPTSYTWSFGSARAMGAIASFSGVDTATPVEANESQASGNSSATSVTAPSVSVATANAWLLTFFALANGNGAFTPPTGMTERLDGVTGAGPNGVNISLATQLRAATGATGTRTATNTSSGIGVGIAVVLRPAAVAVIVPGAFNAFDTSTAAGAITGVIRTKIAGSSFQLAVIALNAARTAVLTSFTGTVTVELLDASDDSGTFNSTTACRSSWTSIQTVAPNPAFASGNNGRINVTFAQANAYRNVRVRVSYTSGGTTTLGCSTDNFAIRPSSFANPTATDADDANPGTTRTLNNTSATAGVVHRAGDPFSVAALAVNASGSATTRYDGSADLVVTSCDQPASCTAGVLSANLSGTFGTGALSGTASYSEAGVVSARLEDDAFASVDENDGSTVAERTITSSAFTIGRFVPDGYTLAVTNVPTLAPGSCASGGSQSFTFVGQPFGFATAPVITATPINAGGGAIVNARPRFDASHVTRSVATSGAPVTLSGTPGITSVATGGSVVTVTFDTTAALSFTRNAATPVASFTPGFTLNVSINDTTETSTTGNTAITGTLSPGYSPIAFATGSGSFHYGRVMLRPTYGEIRRELYLPLEVQSYNGTGWATLSTMATCLVATASSFAYSNATGALAAAGTTPNCASRVTSTITTSNGRAVIQLARPGPVSASTPAAMTVTLNVLSPASGQTCSGTTLTTATTTGFTWLAAPNATNGNHDANPSARVTWGRSRNDSLQLRERFD